VLSTLHMAVGSLADILNLNAEGVFNPNPMN
jgi:hypothetical protein